MESLERSFGVTEKKCRRWRCHRVARFPALYCPRCTEVAMRNASHP